MRLVSFFVLLLLALLPMCDHHGHDGGHGHTTFSGERPEQLALPENLRALLREEMGLLERDMQALLGALVRGDRDRSQELAARIRGSYILEQRLSQGELEELGRLLPEDFVELDSGFHESAGRLEEAARAGRFGDAIDLYASMSRACVQCHSQYATERFPGLRGQ
ncbi:MAG: hypothetical protein KDK35_08260 [Leptospiraceae bacterium]|nr:hypothetical protein [Leptospiraceae bacterium]